MNPSVLRTQMESLTDEEIVRKVSDGQTDIFELLIRRYNQQLYRISRSYLSDEEDIKDAMQSTYLKAFENLKQFRGEARFSTWLIRIAINEALKTLNDKKRTSNLRSVTNEADRDQIEESSVSPAPDKKVMKDDMHEFLEQAIDRLPPKYRSVLVLREIEQLSTRETADCLGLTVVNVKVRLFRAKSLLRAELEKAVDYRTLFSFRGAQCDAMTEQVMTKIRQKIS